VVSQCWGWIGLPESVWRAKYCYGKQFSSTWLRLTTPTHPTLHRKPFRNQLENGDGGISRRSGNGGFPIRVAVAGWDDFELPESLPSLMGDADGTEATGESVQDDRRILGEAVWANP
jgi:hypothetical protein